MPSRPRLATEVTSVKPARFLTVPSGVRTRFETFPPGLAKWGVLVKLNASPRNSSLKRSVSENVRNRPKSQFTTPGPRSELNPAVPRRASLTGVKASGSKYDWPLPTPPRIFTSGLIWSARWLLPGISSEVPEALTENGVPLMKLARLVIRQPLRIAEAAPLSDAQRFPWPNGRSQVPVIERLCVRSKPSTLRFRLKYCRA